MDALHAELVLGNAALTDWEGVPGLKLRFDFLQRAGACPGPLEQWRHGKALDASRHVAQAFPNHPSARNNPEWAERELDRLEALGKVSFFPTGAARPTALNVNPLGLILKEREGVPAEATEFERMKARLIVDLRRGGVNDILPQMGVSYGSVETAVSMLSAGAWMYVIDLQYSFFNWKVADNDTYLLGFYSNVRLVYGKFDYLPFGLKPAPGTNDESVKEVIRILREVESVPLLDFVDDFLGYADTEKEAWERLRKAVRFFIQCGIPVSTKPTGVRPPPASGKFGLGGFLILPDV